MTPTDCRHPNNASVFMPPRNWDVACAITQMRAGVELTAHQKAMLARLKSAETKQTDIEEFLG